MIYSNATSMKDTKGIIRKYEKNIRPPKIWSILMHKENISCTNLRSSLRVLKRMCHLLDPDYSPLLDLMETQG